MKILEKEKAIKLRKRGLTYDDIIKQLSVSRSSLSYWLRNTSYVPSKVVSIKRKAAGLKGAQILHERKIVRVGSIIDIARREIEELKIDELKLLGIMAYWTEGSKTHDALVQVTNSDPLFIKLVLKWFREVCKVKEEKLRVHLRIHPDVNKKEAEQYWSNITGIPIKQFHRTTAKVSGSGGRKYKKLGNGIATITICSTDLHYKIVGWIKGLQERMSL